jgi:hypothetical protein
MILPCVLQCSIRFEFIGGSEIVSPLGSKAAFKFKEGYNKRRTDEHGPYASLKGSGTGNAVTRGNLF